jgi:hypothetical protein
MVNIIDNTKKTKIDEAFLEDAKAQAAENINIKQKTVMKDGTTDEQKTMLKGDKANAKTLGQQFKNLTKDNILLTDKKLLIKAAVKLKQGLIHVPNASDDKKTPLPDYIEIYKISPKARQELLQEYPDLDLDKTLYCACNIALIQQINCGARVIEEDQDFRYQYYTAPLSQVEFIYDPSV